MKFDKMLPILAAFAVFFGGAHLHRLVLRLPVFPR